MAVYNGEKYLNEAVHSILQQTFTSYEFIIVNDGSEDETQEILRHVDDPRIRMIEQSRHGLTASLNTGIKLAKGKYIARQDADDISLPNRLQEQLLFMQQSSNIALLGTWGIQIDKDGENIGYLRGESDPDEIARILPKQNPFIHGSMMFSKSAFDGVGGYRSEFRYAQDYDLALRLAEKHRLANLALELYKKRHTSDIVSIKHKGMQRAFNDLAQRMSQERVTLGIDQLQQQMDVDDLLLDTGKAEDSVYEKNLIYMYLRSGNLEKARPVIMGMLKKRPWFAKHYLQLLLTYVKPELAKKLLQQREKIGF